MGREVLLPHQEIDQNIVFARIQDPMANAGVQDAKISLF
jgi:hypothetical protein